jgi:Flp pilus assembly protein TadD
MDADNAIVDPPLDAQQHLEAACAALAEEQYARALRECQAALDVAPTWAVAHNLHGLVLDELGRLREAAEAYHTALQLDPDNMDAQDNLLGALTEMMAGELSSLADLRDEDPEELARDHLMWTIDLLDEDVEADEEEVDLELALWECDVIISLSPGLAEAHNLRGTVLDELGRPEEAKEAFRTALEIDPGFRAARENLQAMEAEETGQPFPDVPAAPAEPVRCPICDTENAPGATSCRQCGFGLLAAAIGAHEMLAAGPAAGESPPAEVPSPDLGADPAEPDRPLGAQGHLDLAYEHNERGEFAEALIECDAALAADPGPAEAHNLRGMVLEALGRPDEALEAYRTAVELEPEFGDARENLRELSAELRENDPVVTVATFTNPLEAQAARMMLEEKGIQAFIADEHVPAGGVRLMGRESDLEEIVQVLGLPAEDDALQCPWCGSWDVDIPLVGRKRRCESCGYEWKV